MCFIDSGLWCWDVTTQVASDDAPSQRRGWRGVLSFFFEVRVRQGRVTLPCKSLRGVRAPNRYHFRTKGCLVSRRPALCILAYMFVCLARISSCCCEKKSENNREGFTSPVASPIARAWCDGKRPWNGVWDGGGGRFRIFSAADTDSDSCTFPLPFRFPYSSFGRGELGSEHGRPAGLICDSAPAVIG